MKPTLPKFVADYIEENKTNTYGGNLAKWEQIMYILTTLNKLVNHKVCDWIEENKNSRINLIFKAILNGYKVEDPRYSINTNLESDNSIQYVAQDKRGKTFAVGKNNPNFKKLKTTFNQNEIDKMPRWCDEMKELSNE